MTLRNGGSSGRGGVGVSMERAREPVGVASDESAVVLRCVDAGARRWRRWCAGGGWDGWVDARKVSRVLGGDHGERCAVCFGLEA